MKPLGIECPRMLRKLASNHRKRVYAFEKTENGYEIGCTRGRSEEEVLRDALRALAAEQDVIDDIQLGIDDLEAGRGRLLDEVDAKLREKYNIAKDA